MERICNFCNYSTDSYFNWKRHLSTERHKTQQSQAELNDIKQTNDNNMLKCKYCDTIFKHKTNLYRHEKMRCSAKIDLEKKETEKEINDMKKRIDDQNQQIITHLKQEVEHLRKAMDVTQETHKLSSTTLDKSVGALTFLTQYRNKAPVLEQLTRETAKELLHFDKRLYDYLLHHNSEKTLDQYVGDIILKYIKKENPDDQSVWNSDVSRLTYLVRNLVEDEQKWQRDVKGVMFTKYVITPIIDYLRQYLCDCLNQDDNDKFKGAKTSDTESDDTESDDTESDDDMNAQDNFMYRSRDIIETLQTIRSKKFKADLLIHIGSHVSLNKDVKSKKPNKKIKK